MEKRKNSVSFLKCQSCAYLNPQKNYCARYLREAETAVYLCPFCLANENEKMSKVSEMEMAYAEAQNDEECPMYQKAKAEEGE